MSIKTNIFFLCSGAVVANDMWRKRVRSRFSGGNVPVC